MQRYDWELTMYRELEVDAVSRFRVITRTHKTDACDRATHVARLYRLHAASWVLINIYNCIIQWACETVG